VGMPRSTRTHPSHFNLSTSELCALRSIPYHLRNYLQRLLSNMLQPSNQLHYDIS
jgi:hypothetical protein